MKHVESYYRINFFPLKLLEFYLTNLNLFLLLSFKYLVHIFFVINLTFDYILMDTDMCCAFFSIYFKLIFIYFNYQ